MELLQQIGANAILLVLALGPFPLSRASDGTAGDTGGASVAEDIVRLAGWSAAVVVVMGVLQGVFSLAAADIQLGSGIIVIVYSLRRLLGREPAVSLRGEQAVFSPLVLAVLCMISVTVGPLWALVSIAAAVVVVSYGVAAVKRLTMVRAGAAMAEQGIYFVLTMAGGVWIRQALAGY